MIPSVLRQLTAHTCSDSDAETLNSPDQSSPVNRSVSYQLDPCSSERLLDEPIESSSHVESIGGQLICDTGYKPATPSDRERSHFLPFYRGCSDQPPRLCLSRSYAACQPIGVRSLLSQPNPGYRRIESDSQSPACGDQHSLTSSMSIYSPHGDAHIVFATSESGVGSRCSITAPTSLRTTRYPATRSWSRSQSPQICLTPNRTWDAARVRSKKSDRKAMCADSPYAASYCQQMIALIGRQCLSMMR